MASDIKILKLSRVWNEARPAQHVDYDGHQLAHLPLHAFDTIKAGRFRLLHLQPGSDKDQLCFELHVAAFEDEPEYEAISYCWGEVIPSCNIVCNGTRLPVTKNAADALWHFRLPNRVRVLWMDAVCIDQQNKQEKSEQVTDMYRIYGGSRHTLAFAGNAGPHDQSLFAFLADFQSIVHKDIIAQVRAAGLHERNSRVKAAIEGADDWVAWGYLYLCMQNIWEKDAADDQHGLKEFWLPPARLNNAVAREHVQKKIRFGTGVALRKLCQRAYFRRAWVMQELTISSRSTLYIGNNHMLWDDFSAMLWIIALNTESIQGLRPAASPIFMMKHRRVSGEINTEIEGGLSVLEAALLSCGLDAHKPVDKIYAMRNLGTEDSAREIPVDYKEHSLATYLRLGRSVVVDDVRKKAGRLAFALPFLKYTDNHESWPLPSWVPDFDALTVGDIHSMALYAAFHASKDFEDLKAAYLLPTDPNVLVVRGVLTDIITSISDVKPSPIRGPQGIYDEEVELGEFPNNGLFTLSYTMPNWGDFFRMMSKEAKPSSRPVQLQEHTFEQLRENLSNTISRLTAARNFVGNSVDEDTFWRAFSCGINPRNNQRIPLDQPFPAIDAKAFLEAEPSLAVPSNWTSDHPITQSLSLGALIDGYHFLCNVGHWREARLGRTESGKLVWVPVRAQLTDSICLFGGSRTFHVVRPDPLVDGRWKIIGPAYVHGFMDGETPRDTANSEEGFLFIS